MSAGDVTQILVGFGALVAFLTGFSALRQRQRLEFIRESVRTANERLEDLAERQDALPLPSTALTQELRPASTDPLGALVITLSILTAASVGAIGWNVTQDGVFAEELSAALFSAVATALIAITAGIGIFDVLWGRRETRHALRFSTVRQITFVLLRFLILARLVLIQQLHRALALRLDPSDNDGAERDAEILRRIAQLPHLLRGAGIPPWVVARARRNADRALRAGLATEELPCRPGLDELHREATRASLLLRQLRPQNDAWNAFLEQADELRRQLPEWEWIDLLAAWIAAGLMPPSADTSSADTCKTAERLQGLDYQRALGIHGTSRESDSRDLAAWSIADVLERRAVGLASALEDGAPGAYGVLWDLPGTAVPAPADSPALRTSVAGFRERDPLVWLALSQPSIEDAAIWVGDHFVIEEDVRWRMRAEQVSVEDATARALDSPATRGEVGLTLDGKLDARILGHPSNDENVFLALRTAGARDMSDLFRRAAGQDAFIQRLPRVPIAARMERLISPARWFGSLSGRAQIGLVVATAVIVGLLNAF